MQEDPGLNHSPLEELRETLVDLERTRRRESGLRKEAEWLYRGLTHLTLADSPQAVMADVTRLLAEYIPHDDLLIFTPVAEQRLALSFANHSANHTDRPAVLLESGKHLDKVLSGKGMNCFSLNMLPEWQALEEPWCQRIASALLVALDYPGGKALLVCGSGQIGAFSAEHLQMVERFSPLLAQALSVAARKMELARDVAHKTAALKDAKEKAEASEQAKSTFLAVMSHEIRTPMNGVMGAADLLAESTVLSEQDRELVDVIKTSGSLMLNIINDVLDFSRLGSGRIELESTTFTLDGLIRDVCRVMQPVAMQKSLLLDNQSGSSLADLNLSGDCERLKQVLINLLGNAIKFTREGQVSVDARCLSRNCRQARIRVAVTDTGIGIHQDNQGRLFELFTQADSSTSRQYGGTGLGLSICKQIIELMGGEIGVESELGQGSTFWFELLLPVVTAAENKARQEAIPVDTRTMPLRVLVADDNVINQIVIERMLERLEHTVVVVGNGVQALEAVQQQAFDVVFMDWMMPEMDGIEATGQIRALPDPRQSGIPIIAMTANSMEGHEARCLEAGMDTFVSKPATFAEIRQVLYRLFS